jgi:hypothetical protein
VRKKGFVPTIMAQNLGDNGLPGLALSVSVAVVIVLVLLQSYTYFILIFHGN